MKDLLKSFQKRLTNLTPRNRSIYLGKLSQRFDLDLKELYSFSGEYYGRLLEDLLKEKPVKLIEQVDPRLGNSNDLSRRLRIIERQADFIKSERGSEDLHIAWPYVEGKLMNDMPVRAPLVFFPVALRVENGIWVIRSKTDVPINPNKSFLLAYSHYTGQKIEEELLEFDLRELDMDLKSFLSGLFKLFDNSPIKLKFSSDLFEENPGNFKSYRKDEFEKKQKTGRVEVFDYGALGLFPQAGSFLVPDYSNLIQGVQFQDLEEFFSTKTSIDTDENWQVGSHYRKVFLNKVREEKILNPLPLDASQENALKAIKKGHSIVVQGPPGSGKSQLITNLICDNIALGKKVLVVCQKRVALEVVYERLRKLELQQFVARVSDFKNERSRIYEKILSQIEAIHEYQQINNGIDSILLERDFLQKGKRIDQLEEELSELKEVLFETKDSGISPKEIYLSSDPNKPYADTSGLFSHVELDKLDSLRSNFEGYFNYNRKFEKEGYPWSKRKSFKGYGQKDLKEIIKILAEIPKFQYEVNEEIKEFLFMGLSYDEHLELSQRKQELLQFIRLIEEPGVLSLFIRNLKEKTDKIWLENRKQILLDFFVAPGPETTLAGNSLEDAYFKVSRDVKKFRNPLSRILGLIKNPISSYSKGLLEKNKLQISLSGLSSLERKISNRMNLEHNLSLLRKSNFKISELPEKLDRNLYMEWFEKQEKALKAIEIIKSFRSLESFFDFETMEEEKIPTKIRGLITLSEKIIDRIKVWENHLSPNQVFQVLADNTLAQNLEKVLIQDFEDLCKYDGLKEEIKKEIRQLFELPAEAGIKDPNEGWEFLHNSIKMDWIDHLEEKYPILKEVSTQIFENKLGEMRETIREKTRLTKDLVLLRARERTYQDLEYNRLNNLVTYRELRHQVSKKRKIWPLRKLIHEYYQELFDLIPCWMASPESVSAMFPLEQVFDIVLFDEASQCFSEKGIPALYRGKQIGIFGDKNQLSPFDLYQARYEDPDEEGSDMEAESLLDLGSNYLMEIPLSEHYRSESLDLIGFSNQKFYKGSLNCVPKSEKSRSHIGGIRFTQVTGGIWKDNQNIPEARLVVESLKELAKEGENDIGIITFNFQQQHLIQELIESEVYAGNLDLPENLFIKNLENVQGDERDHIIFSPAYGYDESGKLRLNFGSLNLVHGERRLNVAITRARKSIHVFSSLSTKGIDHNSFKNNGPRFFLEYLDYARNQAEGKANGYWTKREDKSPAWYLRSKLGEGLKEKGASSSFDIPFSDLVIRSEQGSAIACLTDDDHFFSASSAKHFFAYIPLELERKDWAFRFSFSRNFWKNQEEEIEEIMHFLNWKRD